MTTYSSRGPTRYDNIVKPDLAAPGNKIISLEAPGAFLAGMYPFLHKAGTGSNAYMQLSGTSMAAADGQRRRRAAAAGPAEPHRPRR